MKDIERPTGGIHENSNFTVEEKGFGGSCDESNNTLSCQKG